MSTAKRILDSRATSRRSNGKMYAAMFNVSEVTKELEELAVPDDESYKILSEIGAKLTQAIRSNMPVKTGSLLRSIQMYRSKRDPYRRLWVGPRYVKGGGPDEGNHAHLLEFGTSERTMKEGLIYGDTARSTFKKFKGPWFFKPFAGKETGKVQATPYIKQAFESIKDSLRDEGQQKYLKALLDAGKKKGFTVR